MMKIEKVICDRCGREITRSITKYHLTKEGPIIVNERNLEYRNIDIDLCANCQDELERWLEDGGTEGL